MSSTGAYSCASCHQLDRHFTDGLPVAIGATGASHSKNTPTLYNVGYNSSFGWQDDGIRQLEAQHFVPLLNTAPVEMGYSPELLTQLLTHDDYAQRFTDAFGTTTITTKQLVQALASYVRTIASPTSAFDRYLFFDDKSGLNESALAGMTLFFSDRLGCAHCHASFNLSGSITHQLQNAQPVFHRMGVSGTTGEFRAPTLRMVAHTAPYMHDGSMADLQQVIEHYENIESDRVPDFTLTQTEIDQLIAFLHAL